MYQHATTNSRPRNHSDDFPQNEDPRRTRTTYRVALGTMLVSLLILALTGARLMNERARLDASASACGACCAHLHAE
jgi:hypothetical protein